MTDFHVGQRVVCVDARPMPHEAGRRWLRGEEIFVGNTYTITQLYVDAENDLICQLKEIRRRRAWRIVHGVHIGYWTGRFRPLGSKAMSIFRAIAADPSRKLENA